MTEAARQARNTAKMAECWPAFGAKVKAVISDLESHGLKPRIQEAWRSRARQAVLFAMRRTKVLYSYHNVTGANGKPEALAVDIIDDDDPTGKYPHRFALMLASSARSHGLQSGIRWGLTPLEVSRVDDVISRKLWDARPSLGWDSLHVQVTGPSLKEAKAGKRP